MTDRFTENHQTLAAVLGINADEAAQLLDASISIRYAPHDMAARSIADSMAMLLKRTVRSVSTNPPPDAATPAISVAVGSVPFAGGQTMRLCVSDKAISIGPHTPAVAISTTLHPIIHLAAAAYGAGAALRAAIPALAAAIPAPECDSIEIPLSAIVGAKQGWLSEGCTFAHTYLAGAGAIGNGFMWALSRFDVAGEITIVDPDSVTDGNLNRCVLFDDADIGRPKAVQLSANGAASLPRLRMIPSVTTLQELAKGASDSRWLRRLIVGVDSPRVRRHLQGELPREVFDASTTGITEFVLHHNVQPTDLACMACIYHESPDEIARERHIAESLGVDVAEVRKHYISRNAAERIHARYASVSIELIIGQAYDSLFKALCSEAKLHIDESRQVLAPFAFVSVLAGIYLAIETVRRTISGADGGEFNYWRLSPWLPPVAELKQRLPRFPRCELCGQDAILKATRDLWA